jgi:hypothetical protein
MATSCTSDKENTPEEKTESANLSNIEQPSDEQIAAAYESAREAMGWFQMNTMPLGNNNTNSNMPAEPTVYDENGAAKVNHPTIKTYDDLQNHLKSLFSNEIAEDLLSTNKYFDKNGELYAIPSDRGSNISKGKEEYAVIKENDKKIIYRVTVENLSEEDLITVIDYSVYDMIYEYTEHKWIFTKFELIR